jgi:hypothetical protein
MQDKSWDRRKRFLFFITAISFLFIHDSVAQRNIIDVPTTEIVENGQLFFQQQVTVGNRNILSGTVFTWGLGKGFEVGFNIQQLTFNTRPRSRIIILDAEQPEESPDLLVNAQKGFKISRWSTLGIGTRSGINVPTEGYGMRLVTFSYLNSQFSIPETKNMVSAGSYYSNTPYSGIGNRYGCMLGAEAEIIKDKFSLIADFLSGTNALSVVNAGFQISLPKQWQIALAAQLPTPGSGNHHGAVVQLSWK